MDSPFVFCFIYFKLLNCCDGINRIAIFVFMAVKKAKVINIQLIKKLPTLIFKINFHFLGIILIIIILKTSLQIKILGCTYNFGRSLNDEKYFFFAN